MKEKILLIFGGKSVEHDISIITALQVQKNVPQSFDVLLCYIDRAGKWWIGDNLDDIKIYHNFVKLGEKLQQVSFVLGENVLLAKKGRKFVEFAKVSSVLNCCHGNIGEDGSVQGVFKTCSVAQTSPNVLSSALCMDKALMKDVCKANNITTPNFCVVRKEEFENSAQNACEKICKKLKFPLVIKPANLGSSIGISVCKTQEELSDALALAFEFDKKVVAEKVVGNLREFNCACLFYKGGYVLSHVNEVTNKGEIFSFDNKYLSSCGKGEEADRALSKKIKTLTERVYQLFECQGIVRVDFLFDEKEKQLYVNEINTIPGSLAFYLFKEVPFAELLSATINQSLLNLQEEEKLVKTFESEALKTFEDVAERAVKK